MKTGFFTFESIEERSSLEDKFSSVGQNTGNMIFCNSLRNIVNLTPLSYSVPSEEIKDFNNFIVTDFIWIRENFDMEYMKNMLIKVGDKSIIPMSIGLQSNDYNPDFQIHSNTISVLKEIQERATMGVRGEYTASILAKHGIKNISIIGCPSMYRNLEDGFNIQRNDRRIVDVACNFKTFYGMLGQKEKHFLSYCADHKMSFVEQTPLEFKLDNCKDDTYYKYLYNWISQKSNVFFNVTQWKDFIKQFDFSIGARFHGNVIALWAGVPALFLNIDSRTKELCDFFHLPMMSIQDFDKEKPINYYYDKTDYSEFNKGYPKLLDGFIDFCIGNKIELKDPLNQYYNRKISSLNNRISELEKTINNYA